MRMGDDDDYVVDGGRIDDKGANVGGGDDDVFLGRQVLVLKDLNHRLGPGITVTSVYAAELLS